LAAAVLGRQEKQTDKNQENNSHRVYFMIIYGINQGRKKMPPAARGRFLKKLPPGPPQKLFIRQKFFGGSRGAAFQKSPPGRRRHLEIFSIFLPITFEKFNHLLYYTGMSEKKKSDDIEKVWLEEAKRKLREMDEGAPKDIPEKDGFTEFEPNDKPKKSKKPPTK
jgi:hypothetical protein